MMSVKEYSLDVNLSVEEIIAKLKSLGYNDITNEDDMLSDEAIIELDNLISSNNEVEDEQTYLEESSEEKGRSETDEEPPSII